MTGKWTEDARPDNAPNRKGYERPVLMRYGKVSELVTGYWPVSGLDIDDRRAQLW